MSMVTLGKKYSSNKITKKSLHKIYQKLLHVIVKIVTSIFRSLPNLTKVKFDRVFKLYSLFLLKIGSTPVFTVPFWTIHIWTLPIWTVAVWTVMTNMTNGLTMFRLFFTYLIKIPFLGQFQVYFRLISWLFAQFKTFYVF